MKQSVVIMRMLSTSKVTALQVIMELNKALLLLAEFVENQLARDSCLKTIDRLHWDMEPLRDSDASCSGTLFWLREFEPNGIVPKGELLWHDTGFTGGKNNLLITRWRQLGCIEIHVDTRNLGSLNGSEWYSLVDHQFVTNCISELTKTDTDNVTTAHS